MLNYSEIQELAQNKVDEFEKNENHSKDDFSFDVIKFANSQGFRVFSAKLGKYAGAVLISKDKLKHFGGADIKKAILVNGKDNALRRRFTIAHELGHYFLHLSDSERQSIAFRDEVYHGQKDRKEKEADFFAANLLMPEEKIRAAMRIFDAFSSSGSKYDKIKYISRLFDVSLSAAEVRLSHLDLLGYDW